MSAFIRVIPGEVQQHGAVGAIVLAHIRYRCESPGPGRIEHEGHRWWRVSHQELGREVGLSRKAVMAALKSLGEVVSANHFPPFENQSRAYRVVTDDGALTSQSPNPDSPDQPESESGHSESESGQGVVPIGTDPCPDSDSVLPLQNLKKGEGEAGRRRPPAPASHLLQPANGKPANWTHGPYGPRCPDHIDDPNPPACHGCRAAKDASKDEEHKRLEHEADARTAIRKAIDECHRCDAFGRLDDLSDCPLHANFRSVAEASQAASQRPTRFPAPARPG